MVSQKKGIKGFFKNQAVAAIVKVIIALLFGLFVLSMTSAALIFFSGPPELMQVKPWLIGFITHSTMVAVSIIIMLILSKGKLNTYGFKITKHVSLKQIIPLSLGIGFIGALIGSFIFIENSASTEAFSFVQTVVFIWFYASICEEVLTRGLIQGLLKPLIKHGFFLFKLRISLPVLVGALFFALMHTALLTTGMNSGAVFNIVLFTFILGIIAGYHREKTGSLIPAVIVHMFFNVGGFCAGLLIQLFKTRI